MVRAVRAMTYEEPSVGLFTCPGRSLAVLPWYPSSETKTNILASCCPVGPKSKHSLAKFILLLVPTRGVDSGSSIAHILLPL